MNFPVNQPQAVQSGSHTTPQSQGGGNVFGNALSGLSSLAGGYASGGYAGLASAGAGLAGGGQQPTSQPGPMATSGVAPTGLNSADTMMNMQGTLQSSQMTPGLGQAMDSMAPEDKIGGDLSANQAGVDMAAAISQDPFINPHVWEL